MKIVPTFHKMNACFFGVLIGGPIASDFGIDIHFWKWSLNISLELNKEKK